MYEALLQSAERPFKATPDTRFYFAYDSIENARQSVTRAVLRAEGPCLVLGGAGLGKTLLSLLIAEAAESRFDIVKLHATGLCSRRALLQSILFELGLPYRGLSEGELRMSIMDRLMPSPETAPDGVLIIVDEAHTLSAKLLEELRLITNFARNGQPRARLVMIGSMRLEDTFAHPQMDSFNQRIAARCYLQPMNREQTAEFVRHQLRCAKVNPASIITNDGLRSVYAASEGVPRLVNQVMDHALVLGITQGQCPISASLIDEAWSDLQQLPTPWNSNEDAKRTTSNQSATIEFGSLDEDEDAFGDTALSDQIYAVAGIKSDEEDLIAFSSDEDAFPIQPVDGDPEKAASGFFAAFSEADAESLRSYIEGSDADPISGIPRSSSPTLNPQPPKTTSTAVTKDTTTVASNRSESKFVFDASKAFGNRRHNVAYPREMSPAIATNSSLDPIAPPSNVPVSSPNRDFFASFGAPVTHVQMDTTSESENAYDADGVWSNDPPIEAGRVSENKASTLRAESVFGDDFEDEISLEVTGSVGRVRQIFEPAASQKLRDAAATEDRIVGQQANTSPPQPPVTVSPSTQELANWTVNVVATDPEREVQLHHEIEDMVSQLNFSAFAIEPFSVEQIEIDYERGPGAKPKTALTSSDRENIYTLHTAKSDDLNEVHGPVSHDDDRDLLIIEEELPISNRVSSESIGAPISKAAPYSQLFAKLRH